MAITTPNEENLKRMMEAAKQAGDSINIGKKEWRQWLNENIGRLDPWSEACIPSGVLVEKIANYRQHTIGGEVSTAIFALPLAVKMTLLYVRGLLTPGSSTKCSEFLVQAKKVFGVIKNDKGDKLETLYDIRKYRKKLEKRADIENLEIVKKVESVYRLHELNKDRTSAYRWHAVVSGIDLVGRWLLSLGFLGRMLSGPIRLSWYAHKKILGLFGWDQAAAMFGISWIINKPIEHIYSKIQQFNNIAQREYKYEQFIFLKKNIENYKSYREGYGVGIEDFENMSDKYEKVIEIFDKKFSEAEERQRKGEFKPTIGMLRKIFFYSDEPFREERIKERWIFDGVMKELKADKEITRDFRNELMGKKMKEGFEAKGENINKKNSTFLNLGKCLGVFNREKSDYKVSKAIEEEANIIKELLLNGRFEQGVIGEKGLVEGACVASIISGRASRTVGEILDLRDKICKIKTSKEYTVDMANRELGTEIDKKYIDRISKIKAKEEIINKAEEQLKNIISDEMKIRHEFCF